MSLTCNSDTAVVCLPIQTGNILLYEQYSILLWKLGHSLPRVIYSGVWSMKLFVLHSVTR